VTTDDEKLKKNGRNDDDGESWWDESGEEIWALKITANRNVNIMKICDDSIAKLRSENVVNLVVTYLPSLNDMGGIDALLRPLSLVARRIEPVLPCSNVGGPKEG